MLAMGQKRHKLLSEQIRAAIRASDLSCYAICRTLSIDQGQMSRFMNGKGGLAMASLDAIGKLLHLAVIKEPDRGKHID